MWHAFQCRILLERSGFGLNELLGGSAQFNAAAIKEYSHQSLDVIERNVINCVGHGTLPKKAKDSNREMVMRSEEHTSELQSLMRISYAVFCLEKKIDCYTRITHENNTNYLN